MKKIRMTNQIQMTNEDLRISIAHTPTAPQARRQCGSDAAPQRLACDVESCRTAWSPPATARSTRSGSRRATASGRATSPRTRPPFEAGLGFAVALDKEPEFIGRDALVAAKAAGPRKRLRCLVLDDPRSVCLGNEPVRVGGEIVGRVTSGGYGFAVERSIAYAYLPPDRAAIGTRGEVEVFGEWIGFEVAREPLYDPDGRIRS